MSIIRKLPLLILVAILSIALFPKTTFAEPDGEIMFILDASSSMLYKDGSSKTRIDRAKEALISTLKSLPSDQKIGVRVYGSKIPDTNQTEGCKDSSLISVPKPNNSAKLVREVGNVQAKGWTLMSKALNDVKGDFKGEGPKSVILVSDGVDTCNPSEACKTAKNMVAGGTNIKVNTLGLVVNSEARAQLQCIAKNSGGSYYDVNNLDRLQKALTALSNKSVDLMKGDGIKVRGTADISESPALLPDTLYEDTITGDGRVFYSFDALPKQKVTITVKAADNNDELGLFNFLSVRGYTKLEGSTLSATGIYGESERFNRGPDVVTTVYKIDTEEQKITKPQPIAFDVGIRSNEGSTPIQIQIQTEGGEAPNNATVAEAIDANNKQENEEEGSLLLLILTVLAAIMAAGIVAYIVVRRKKDEKEPIASGDSPKE